MNNFQSCRQCNALVKCTLENPSLVVCPNCYAIVYENVIAYNKPGPSRVPSDWSFVQIGTTLWVEGESYTIIGRVRVQLLNDYKNFWCAAATTSKYVWVMESFASFAVLDPVWHVFDHTIDSLRAGTFIQNRAKAWLGSEYVEKCEHVSYEGEIGSWKLFFPGFFLTQSSSTNGATSVFLVNTHNDIQYLSGVKVESENLKLQNVVEWNEWK